MIAFMPRTLLCTFIRATFLGRTNSHAHIHVKDCPRTATFTRETDVRISEINQRRSGIHSVVWCSNLIGAGIEVMGSNAELPIQLQSPHQAYPPYPPLPTAFTISASRIGSAIPPLCHTNCACVVSVS